jgi:hypothetical protein
MKSDKSAYFPLGLVLGAGLGASFGNVALGALLGMTTGLILSTSGRRRSN